MKVKHAHVEQRFGACPDGCFNLFWSVTGILRNLPIRMCDKRELILFSDLKSDLRLPTFQVNVHTLCLNRLHSILENDVPLCFKT